MTRFDERLLVENKSTALTKRYLYGVAMQLLIERDNAHAALQEQNRFNNLGNDLKAYLFNVALWGLNDSRKPDKPTLKEFGLESYE